MLMRFALSMPVRHPLMRHTLKGILCRTDRCVFHNSFLVSRERAEALPLPSPYSARMNNLAEMVAEADVDAMVSASTA